MQIFKPVYLWLHLLLLPVLWLLVIGYLRGKIGLRRIAGGWRNAGLQEVYLSKTFLGGLSFTAAVMLLVFSLADIRGEESLVEDERRGYEIALALDVSRSMLAGDVQPSRLVRAAQEVGTFIRNRPDTRFSLVLFKGKAALLLPMTRDMSSFDPILRNLRPSMVAASGSNLQEGIEMALSSFQESGRFRSILLFTDGESLTGRPLDAAVMSARAGVPICPVVVGTSDGGGIPIGDGRMLQDDQGQPVVTRLNRGALEDIAAASGGKVFSLEEMERLWRELPSIWKDVEPGEEEPELRLERPSLYRVFVLLALLLLAISVLIRGYRWRRSI